MCIVEVDVGVLSLTLPRYVLSCEMQQSRALQRAGMHKPQNLVVDLLLLVIPSLPIYWPLYIMI